MAQFFAVHPENPQERLIKQAADIIRKGGVIVYPTDSCYALGCQLGNKNAMEKILQIRKIDQKHHLTLMCGDLSELELGAFCIAMCIKGETPDELAGFLDALTPHMQRPRSTCPVVVLPSYSGARRQPCLTPLLALHLAQIKP